MTIPHRQWKKGGTEKSDNRHFMVMSYNVLAPLYCTQDRYRFTDPRYLNWEYRRSRILDEITFYAPDFVCLQVHGLVIFFLCYTGCTHFFPPFFFIFLGTPTFRLPRRIPPSSPKARVRRPLPGQEEGPCSRRMCHILPRVSVRSACGSGVCIP
jgi:hypothetical protein